MNRSPGGRRPSIDARPGSADRELHQAKGAYEAERDHNMGTTTAPDHTPFPGSSSIEEWKGVRADQIKNLTAVRKELRRLRQSGPGPGLDFFLIKLCRRLCGGKASVAALEAQYGAPWLEQLRSYFFYETGYGRKIYIEIQKSDGEVADAGGLIDTIFFLEEKCKALENTNAGRPNPRKRQADAECQTDPLPAPAVDQPKRTTQTVLYCAGDGCGAIIEIRPQGKKRPIMVEGSTQCAGCYARHVTYGSAAPGWHCGACTADWAPLTRGAGPSCLQCQADV